MNCSLCGHPLSPTDTPWRQVVAWEKKASGPSRRGGSDLVLREPTGEFAHGYCVGRVRDGLAPLQEALL